MRDVLGPFLRFLVCGPDRSGPFTSSCSRRAQRSHPAGEEQLLGDQANVVRAFITDRFGLEVARMAVALTAAAVAFGAVLGIDRRRPGRASRRMARDRAELAGQHGVDVAPRGRVALHGWLELRGMAKKPQLYADGWYAQGGVLRTVQVVATDVSARAGSTSSALSR